MQLFHFENELWLPQQLDQVFPFFADAFNLEEITPPWLHFRVVSAVPIRMQAGTEISYELKIRGIPVRWRSRITAWEPPFRFADEQIDGPYRTWIHEHQFTEHSGGTLCKDVVSYAVLGGSLVNRFFVAPDVRRIFGYRSRRLEQIFLERLLRNATQDSIPNIA